MDTTGLRRKARFQPRIPFPAGGPLRCRVPLQTLQLAALRELPLEGQERAEDVRGHPTFASGSTGRALVLHVSFGLAKCVLLENVRGFLRVWPEVERILKRNLVGNLGLSYRFGSSKVRDGVVGVGFEPCRAPISIPMRGRTMASQCPVPGFSSL